MAQKKKEAEMPQKPVSVKHATTFDFARTESSNKKRINRNIEFVFMVDSRLFMNG